MWKVLVLILLLVVIAAINYAVVESLWWWGFFQTTYNHAEGSCRKLSGTEKGSEDIHLLDDGKALISSSMRQGGANNTAGKIILFDMVNHEQDAVELAIEGAGDFKLVRPQSVSVSPASSAVCKDHITSVLREIYWLPVRQRDDFKLAVLVYEALHNLTAPYLVDDCQLIVSNVSRRRLRSADIDTCIVPRTNTRLADRSFAVAGPRLWNSLSGELRQPDIELDGEFRRLLKKVFL